MTLPVEVDHDHGVQIRTATPSDYERIVAVVDDWWGGRNMRPLLPRLFLDHFADRVSDVVLPALASPRRQEILRLVWDAERCAGELIAVVFHRDDAADDRAQSEGHLRVALRQAKAGASDHGIQLRVTSGWRSAEDQAQLFRDAVAEYGSEAEAARWVATPETSAHVSGDAIDVGPADAAAWLSEHGAEYGLCQIYGNEPWHYELRPDAIDHGCPPMYADPTHDPRMQQ